MALELITIPCLTDNYAFLIHNPMTGKVALVDVPEAAPILHALSAHGWTLSDVLLTHHHGDHIDGLPDLLAGLADRPQIWGAAADAHRLPNLDHALTEADTPQICGETVQILDMPGHTVGHIAFHFPYSKLLFSGDSLMVMGCGRLFEGTPAQMWASLRKTDALPGDTRLCSGHEYTAANIRFALSLERGLELGLDPGLEPGAAHLISLSDRVTALRDAGKPTIPSTLAQERLTNPFLIAPNPDRFTEIRARKDKF
jgi:hydroxyacylglutathione hydrolase